MFSTINNLTVTVLQVNDFHNSGDGTTLRVCMATGVIYIADWFNAMRGLVSLALIASVVTLVLAVVYTFFHSVNKNVVLTLFIVASWLSGNGSFGRGHRAHTYY